jgi:mercuric ion transport protein
MWNLVRSTSLGTAVITAVLPLACCWGPTLLAGVAILSGGATQLAWLHPYEPYLYGISFLTLGYSHFNAYKARKADADDCENCKVGDEGDVRANKYGKIALWVATGLVMIMFSVNQFPEWFVNT